MNKKSYYVHATAVIDDDCTIGDGTRIWHFSHLMSGCVVGRNCTVGQNVMIADGATLGDNVKVQNNVSIYSGVTCEDDVFIGPSCVFTNVVNPRSAISRKHAYMPTRVCRGASIGANATIVCGNVIGEYAMVGAGTVVAKNVPPYSLVVGNPARQIGWVSKNGLRLAFDKAGVAVCPESGERYAICDGKVAAIESAIDAEDVANR